MPHADQHAEVGDQLGVGDAAGGGAHDGRHALRPDRLHDRLEPVALVGRLDLARDAAELAGRHEDQVAAGERDVGRDPGALEAARLLDDLDQHVVAAADLLVDGVAGAARGDLDVADVERRLVDVVDVEEGVAAQPDVAEAGAHAGQDVDDLPFVDRADDALFALDVDLRETTVLEDRDAVLPRIARDENVGRQSVCVLQDVGVPDHPRGALATTVSPSSSGRRGRALPSSGVREIGVEPARRSSANPTARRDHPRVLLWAAVPVRSDDGPSQRPRSDRREAARASRTRVSRTSELSLALCGLDGAQCRSAAPSRVSRIRKAGAARKRAASAGSSAAIAAVGCGSCRPRSSKPAREQVGHDALQRPVVVANRHRRGGEAGPGVVDQPHGVVRRIGRDGR